MRATLALTIVLLRLTVFQILLALGLPLGRAAWGGYHETLPAVLRVGSLVSAGLYITPVALLLTSLFYVLARRKA